MTGLLVCTEASGRAVRSCWDPWPEYFDFQVFPDRSIEPPPEPLPLRYNLDNIWGNGPASGTTSTFADAPKAAPDDATRLQNLVKSVPYYAMQGRSAAFNFQGLPVPIEAQAATTIFSADYDGTFVPSNSIRTVTPPSAAAELAATNQTDPNFPGVPIGPPGNNVPPKA